MKTLRTLFTALGGLLLLCAAPLARSANPAYVRISTASGADAWESRENGVPLDARYSHSAVWTGSEMIVWGGLFSGALNDGSRFNPAANRWVPLSATGAPSARSQHTAVWTGSEMIVWGGTYGPILNDGGLFTDTWSYHPRPLGVTLTFGPITPGGTYTVQRSSDLAAGSWGTLPGAVVSDFGTERTVIDPFVTSDKAFYRVFSGTP